MPLVKDYKRMLSKLLALMFAGFRGRVGGFCVGLGLGEVWGVTWANIGLRLRLLGVRRPWRGFPQGFGSFFA